jgi:hypothetical protein
MTTASKTDIYKGRDGWEAHSEIDTGDGRVLRIDTHKRGLGGVSTSATSVVPSADGGGFSYLPFSDFCETVIQEREVRCTEKSVRNQHLRAMLNATDIKAKALAFYAERAKVQADLMDRESTGSLL